MTQWGFAEWFLTVWLTGYLTTVVPLELLFRREPERYTLWLLCLPAWPVIIFRTVWEILKMDESHADKGIQNPEPFCQAQNGCR